MAKNYISHQDIIDKVKQKLLDQFKNKLQNNLEEIKKFQGEAKKLLMTYETILNDIQTLEKNQQTNEKINNQLQNSSFKWSENYEILQQFNTDKEKEKINIIKNKVNAWAIDAYSLINKMRLILFQPINYLFGVEIQDSDNKTSQLITYEISEKSFLEFLNAREGLFSVKWSRNGSWLSLDINKFKEIKEKIKDQIPQQNSYPIYKNISEVPTSKHSSLVELGGFAYQNYLNRRKSSGSAIAAFFKEKGVSAKTRRGKTIYTEKEAVKDSLSFLKGGDVTIKKQEYQVKLFTTTNSYTANFAGLTQLSNFLKEFNEIDLSSSKIQNIGLFFIDQFLPSINSILNQKLKIKQISGRIDNKNGASLITDIVKDLLKQFDNS